MTDDLSLPEELQAPLWAEGDGPCYNVWLSRAPETCLWSCVWSGTGPGSGDPVRQGYPLETQTRSEKYWEARDAAAHAYATSSEIAGIVMLLSDDPDDPAWDKHERRLSALLREARQQYREYTRPDLLTPAHMLLAWRPNWKPGWYSKDVRELRKLRGGAWAYYSPEYPAGIPVTGDRVAVAPTEQDVRAAEQTKAEMRARVWWNKA